MSAAASGSFLATLSHPFSNAVSVIETATGARRHEITANHHMLDSHSPLIAAAESMAKEEGAASDDAA